jgi:hypothetical protein
MVKMEERKISKFNYIAVPVIAVWLIAIIYMITPIFQSTLELGHSTLGKSYATPVKLDIVNAGDQYLYFYDKTRENLLIYSKDGERINTYNFKNSGSVQIVSINENNEFFWVYYNRKRTFYKIDFSGEVIDTHYNGTNSTVNSLDFDNEYQEYIIKNDFLHYSIYNEDELVFKINSWQPLIVLGVIVFFGGMMFSLKHISNSRKRA